MVRALIAFVLLLVSVSPAPTHAAFHTALISEVMSGVHGDSSVQYVEIRVIGGVASAVSGSVLTAFDCTGMSSSVLLTVSHNITDGAMDAHWLMATTNFAAAFGITPDFTWNPAVSGSIDPSCGMVCWGAPGLVPPAPGWDTTDQNNYVDCVGYGGYSGPRKTSTHDGTPVSGFPTGNPPGDGMLQSLTRLTASGSNLADFQLADPTPTNNAGDIGVFGATTTTTTTAPGGSTTTSTTIEEPSSTTSTSTTTVTAPHVTTSTTTLPPELACAPSVVCDDGDACSVDHCVVGTGCVHDPVGSAADLDRVGPACTGQNVPSSVGQQFAKGCGLVEAARTQASKKAKGSLTKAARAFGKAASVAAKAGKRKKTPVSGDCTAALHGVLGDARNQALQTKSGL
jgi:hypothetical protein